MNGKTLYDDPFDPKTYMSRNVVACYTNLAPAIQSDLQTLQVLFKGRHAKMETKHHHRTGLQDTQECRKPSTLVMVARRIYSSSRSWMSTSLERPFMSKPLTSLTIQAFLNFSKSVIMVLSR